MERTGEGEALGLKNVQVEKSLLRMLQEVLEIYLFAGFDLLRPLAQCHVV